MCVVIDSANKQEIHTQESYAALYGNQTVNGRITALWVSQDHRMGIARSDSKSPMGTNRKHTSCL